MDIFQLTSTGDKDNPKYFKHKATAIDYAYRMLMSILKLPVEKIVKKTLPNSDLFIYIPCNKLRYTLRKVRVDTWNIEEANRVAINRYSIDLKTGVLVAR
mgnify:CR=1 FL=1